MSAKTISNARIIAALMQESTIKEAAAAAGISPRALYDRMQEREFRAEYADAKADIIRAAVNSLTERLTAAVDTIAAIMADEQASPAMRLQAAQLIINNAGKFIDRLNRQEDTSRSLHDPTELFI